MLTDAHCGSRVPVLEPADGAARGIIPANQEASAIVSESGEAMKLMPGRKIPDCQVLLFAAGCSAGERKEGLIIEDALMEKTFAMLAEGSRCLPPDPSECFFEANPGRVSCLVFPFILGDILIVQMLVVNIIARQSERNGALLLHRSLVEWNAYGIILSVRIVHYCHDHLHQMHIKHPFRLMSNSASLAYPSDTAGGVPFLD